MKEVKADLRFEKTCDKLIESYLDLLTNNLSNKVLDICDNAHVTAMTFYHHFDSKNDFLQFTASEQLKAWLPIPIKLKPNDMKQLSAYLVKSAFAFANENAPMFNNCLKRGDKTYLDILEKTINYYVYQEISLILDPLDPYEIEVMTNLLTGAINKSLQAKLEKSQPINSSFVWKEMKFISSWLLHDYK